MELGPDGAGPGLRSALNLANTDMWFGCLFIFNFRIISFTYFILKIVLFGGTRF